MNQEVQLYISIYSESLEEHIVDESDIGEIDCFLCDKMLRRGATYYQLEPNYIKANQVILLCQDCFEYLGKEKKNILSELQYEEARGQLAN